MSTTAAASADAMTVLPPIVALTPQAQSQSLRELCASLHTQVQAFLAEEAPTALLKQVQKQTKISYDVCTEAFQRYGLQHVSLSYNGGKDCLVLLIVFLAALHPFLDSTTSDDKSPSVQESLTIPSIYALPSDSFPQIEDFVTRTASHYHLSLTRYTLGTPFPDTTSPPLSLKSSFAHYLDTRKNVKAIFVGTRRTDPHGAKLTHFDRTDHGWPDFVRVHPVIDWHYVEVWAFIKHLGVEYCELYDQGYTSLGGKGDTKPNPMLKKEGCGEGGEAQYRPAYELTEDMEERLGRR